MKNWALLLDIYIPHKFCISLLLMEHPPAFVYLRNYGSELRFTEVLNFTNLDVSFSAPTQLRISEFFRFKYQTFGRLSESYEKMAQIDQI